jgi:hypothetical protein
MHRLIAKRSIAKRLIARESIVKRPVAKELIARFLLLVALVGNLAPLVQAATAPPPHACCVRKSAHRCHDSALSESDQLAVRDAGACSHDCCRAVTTAQWAHAQPPAAASRARIVEAYHAQSSRVSPITEVSSFQSTRAPPAY